MLIGKEEGRRRRKKEEERKKNKNKIGIFAFVFLDCEKKEVLGLWGYILHKNS